MNTAHDIKRGVSLFSFWRDYMQGRMSVEECIAAVAKLDTPGIEIVAEHMVPGFPNPPDSFFADWDGWMRKYARTPVAYDMYLATKGPTGEPATEDEVMAAVVRDIKYAARMGCTVLRMIVRTPPEIMEQSAPYAEEYNVRLGLEIQAPLHLEDEWLVRHREVMERVDSPYLGLIPDMSIFTKRYPRVMRDRNIRDGAQQRIADYIMERYDSHEPLDDLRARVEGMGGNARDLEMVEQARQQTCWQPRELLQIMPRMFHIHAKCFEMLSDCTEYSFPYDEVVPVLIEGGYNGYLSTESEGWRFTGDAFEVSSIEQIERHQTMLKRLLGEDESESGGEKTGKVAVVKEPAL